MVDAQEWLDKNYPKDQREDIIKLDISKNWKTPNNEKLANSLNLSDFINCKELDCSWNKLTNLTINNCPKLKEISCSENQLTSLDISDQLELIYLDCSFNEYLSTLIVTNNPQLIWLHYPNCQLITLQLANNPSLKILDCSNNTNLTFDLEYLPDNLKYFDCQGTKLVEELETYGKPNEDESNYLALFKSWKQVWLQKQLEIERLKILTLERKIQELTNLIKVQKEKIIEAYTHFFAEKDLLQKLVAAHLEYTKAKQDKQPVYKLKKQKERIYNEIEEKVGEELMEQVETILYECEELIHYEAELEAEISQNQKLIENHQQVIQQITYNINNLNLTQVTQGNALIGNDFRDDTKIDYQMGGVLEAKVTIPNKDKRKRRDSWEENSATRNKIEEIPEQTVHILQPPKS